MKGSIACCLRDMIVEKFGQVFWRRTMTGAGFADGMIVTPVQDLDDKIIMALVQSACRELELPTQQLAELFGDYWVMTYSQRIYGAYYEKYKTAKDFLLGLDDIHRQMTQNIQNAHPPRFKYEWQDENTLVITYISPRDLIDFQVALTKSIGKFYHCELELDVFSRESYSVRFL